MVIKLSGELRVASRTRYNAWDLLADVGGFSDGLNLLGYILTSIYASLAFKADYLDG